MEKIYMQNLYNKIIIVAAIVVVVCSIFLGRSAYIEERDAIVGVFESETKAAAANVDSMFAAMTSTFDDEVPKMEAFLAERERTDDEITEYLRQRTRWLSTTVDAMYVDLFCCRRGKYSCGNYWHPPKSIDFTKRPWYLAAMAAQGKTTVISPYKPHDYPFQLVAVSRKLVYPETVLSLDVQLSDLEPVLNVTRDGKNGGRYFFAPDGAVIMSDNTPVGLSDELKKVYEEVKKKKEEGKSSKFKDQSSKPSTLNTRLSTVSCDDTPFVFGDNFVFHSHSNNGWCVVSLHNRADITGPASWAVLKPIPWLLLVFFIVYLVVEFFRYRADFAAKTDEMVQIRGNLAQLAIFIVTAAVFCGLVWLGERQVLQFENRIAVTGAETTIRSAVAPVVAFIETARGATGYCSRHIARLMRAGADHDTIASETKELIGIYRSMPNRNYRSIFVAQPDWYADSMGWTIPPGYKLSEQDFYLTAIRNSSENVFTPPYRSRIDGSMVVTITRAVDDNEETVVGIDIPVKMLQTLAKGIHLEGAGSALLISQDGSIIDHRHFRTTFESDDSFDMKSVISRALRETGSFRFDNASGKKLLAISVPLSIGGRAIVIGDEHMLKTTLSAYRGQTLAVIVAIFLVAMVIGFISLRRIRRQRERDIVAVERARQADRLQEALSMAQSASRAKTTFLNNMSHDIRTPMNAIIGFTGLAENCIDNKDQVRDYLAKIGRASSHLLSLINDVLDMSRIESGKLNLDEKEENLQTVINALRDIVQPDISAKQHTFTVEMDNIKDKSIICDKLRLNQVLLNIISNAIKYTPAGGNISMNITEKAVKPNGHATYEFCIKDNGMGMDAEFLKTIYDPFTRVKSSTVSGIQGTGLGMAITKNIVNMMDGEIDIQSTMGKGTQVTVTIDFKVVDDCAYIKGKTAKITEENYNFADKKILLVEDNELNREIATEILESNGFIVDTAEDGDIAVEKVKSQSVKGKSDYDLILMDVQMPRMDGYEATRRIRAWEVQSSEFRVQSQTAEHPNSKLSSRIPIIAMTANAFEEDRKLAIEAGMDEHVAKPINVKKLMATLAKYI